MIFLPVHCVSLTPVCVICDFSHTSLLYYTCLRMCVWVDEGGSGISNRVWLNLSLLPLVRVTASVQPRSLRFMESWSSTLSPSVPLPLASVTTSLCPKSFTIFYIVHYIVCHFVVLSKCLVGIIKCHVEDTNDPTMKWKSFISSVWSMAVK